MFTDRWNWSVGVQQKNKIKNIKYAAVRLSDAAFIWMIKNPNMKVSEDHNQSLNLLQI